jgi:acyl-CoA synthetase (AMP-forming)/AMP-acid ligase II
MRSARDGFPSVVRAFGERLQHHPDGVIIRLVASDGTVANLTYGALHDQAVGVVAGLHHRGVRRGDRIVVAVPTCAELFAIYLGCLIAGVIPIMAPAPRANINPDLYCGQLTPLLMFIGAKLLVIPSPSVAGVQAQVATPVCAGGELAVTGATADIDLAPDPDSIAHLQLTSGTTGIPRAAVVRHRHIAENVMGIGLGIRHRDGEDVLTSWLPMFHDMGLIGVSYTLYWDSPLLSMDPLQFAREPLRWLRMISDHGGTLSPAPNSAFQLCARLAERRPPERLDLSRWRVALCGAEPVKPATLRDFVRIFGRYGFRPEVLLPVYGLAESTLCTTMPDPDEPPRYDRVDADALHAHGRAEPTAQDGRVVELTCLGPPLRGLEVRIVDDQGNPRGPRELGEIEIRGTSVVDGYWGVPAEDRAARAGGFFSTGDVGYLAGGDLYISGRSKDIIIVHGRNFASASIEAEVEAALGSTPPAGVAAVGLPDPRSQTEAVHIVVESSVLPRPDQAAEEIAVRTRLDAVLGLTGVLIHWVPRRWIPRTTSGKIQRQRCQTKISQVPGS